MCSLLAFIVASSILQPNDIAAKLQGPSTLSVKCTFTCTLNIDELKKLTGNTLNRSFTGEHYLYKSNDKLKSELRVSKDDGLGSISYYDKDDCYVVYPTYEDGTGSCTLIKKCTSIKQAEFVTPTGHLIIHYFMPTLQGLFYGNDSKFSVTESVPGSLQSATVIITNSNQQHKCEIRYGADAMPELATFTSHGKISSVIRYTKSGDAKVAFVKINYNNEVELTRYIGEFSYDVNSAIDPGQFRYDIVDGTYIRTANHIRTGDHVHFNDGNHYFANNDKSPYKNVRDALALRSAVSNQRLLISCAVIAIIILATLLVFARYRRVVLFQEKP